MNLVKIICDAPGFRRCGRAWPAESLIDLTEFDAAEQAALLTEKTLRVIKASEEEAQSWQQGQSDGKPGTDKAGGQGQSDGKPGTDKAGGQGQSDGKPGTDKAGGQGQSDGTPGTDN